MIEKFCVGYDMKGNRIEYIRQPDGSWLNALTEQVWPDELIALYFPKEREGALCPEPECGCVLPEQSCPVCREAARKVYSQDEPLFFHRTINPRAGYRSSNG